MEPINVVVWLEKKKVMFKKFGTSTEAYDSSVETHGHFLATVGQINSFVSKVSLAQLAQFYSELSGAEVKRFPSKEDAARRLWKFISPKGQPITLPLSGKSATIPTNESVIETEEEPEMATTTKKRTTKKAAVKSANKKTAATKKAATKKAATKKAAPKKKGGKSVQAAAPSTSSGRGRRSAFEDSAKIKMLVKENPKRQGSASYDRFELYFGAKTVGDFIDAGGTTSDLHYDIQKGFIEVN